MGHIDLKKVEWVVTPILEEVGLELVQVKFLNDQGRWVLRVMIDRKEEGGVTVGDCAKVSREIETILEVEEVVPQRYSLEVSSPGLDRPLVREKDFTRFAGRKVALKSRAPQNGRQNFKGTLIGLQEGKVEILVDGVKFQVPLTELEKAHLVYEEPRLGGENHVRGSHAHH